ncbi:hypothetical protein [Streptomyces cellulosae]|uniref:hypothetical protein n=1 Tax=Streptomyces cellulosae TaxID=1968 RepID=UPI00307B4C0F
MQLIEPQPVSVVTPLGHRKTCHFSHSVHVVTHVIHMAALAFVIHMVHVRRVVSGLVVIMPRVVGVCGMVTVAVVRAAVVRTLITLIVGCFGRRAVVAGAVAVLVAVLLVIAMLIGARLVRHFDPVPSHRPVEQVAASHVEHAGDLPALPRDDAQGGFRHRPLDAVQPLRLLRRQDAADD